MQRLEYGGLGDQRLAHARWGAHHHAVIGLEPGEKALFLKRVQAKGDGFKKLGADFAAVHSRRLTTLTRLDKRVRRLVEEPVIDVKRHVSEEPDDKGPRTQRQHEQYH